MTNDEIEKRDEKSLPDSEELVRKICGENPKMIFDCPK